MNPNDEVNRILNTRTLTSTIEVYDDEPLSERIDIIVRDSEGNLIKTFSILDYPDLEQITDGILRNWND